MGSFFRSCSYFGRTDRIFGAGLRASALAGLALLFCGYSARAQNNLGTLGDIHVTGDFDGDGTLDAAVWRPSNGIWYVQESTAGFIEQQWGLPGDIPVPGDYDGDGKTDFAVWRPSEGAWYIIPSATGPSHAYRTQWGLSGDIPIVGDFDGDGKTDLVVFRPANAVWYCLLSTGPTVITQLGLPGDVPVAGDYDGGGKTELAVWRSTTATWYIMSSTGVQSQQQWGLPNDVPYAADFDGDGKVDFAVWRPTDQRLYLMPSSGAATSAQISPAPTNFVDATKFAAGGLGKGVFIRVNGDFDGDGQLDFALFDMSLGKTSPASTAAGFWYIIESGSATTPRFEPWGQAADIPVPGNYEGSPTVGNAVTDLAVWRPVNGTWYVQRSNGNSPLIQQWGELGDVPQVGDFDGDGKVDFVVWRPSNAVLYCILTTQGIVIAPFGLPGDVPVVGDYTGAKKTEIAVWRPANAIWFLSVNGSTVSFTFQWGLPGDVPIAGDFDGDGSIDYTVWRPSTGSYYFRFSRPPGSSATVALGAGANAEIYNQPPITPFIGPQ